MSLYRIKQEFDDIIRTARLDDMEPLRDRWINQAWERITEEFVIPSLTKGITFGAVANQQYYLFPYDYNGTEIGLKYQLRRMDPVPDESMMLRYEKRTGNMGATWYYDWSGIAGEDLLTLTGCTLTNQSKTVLTDSVDTALNSAYWIRIDPYLDANNSAHDYNDMVDPGEYGYLIDAGTQVVGTSFQLDKAYRGPTGDNFTVHVRPAEQQQFIVYGIPTTTAADDFYLRYASRPMRLYNDGDVPEWPNMEEAIAYLAVSVALDWHHNTDLSKVFWARAMNRISNLEKRRNRSRALVSDLTIGSVVGRQTGLRGIYMARGFRSGIGRYR